MVSEMSEWTQQTKEVTPGTTSDAADDRPRIVYIESLTEEVTKMDCLEHVYTGWIRISQKYDKKIVFNRYISGKIWLTLYTTV